MGFQMKSNRISNGKMHGREIIQNSMCVLVAFLSTWGLTRPYLIGPYSQIFANNIMIVPIFCLILYAFQWSVKTVLKRLKIISSFPAVILGICYRVCNEFYATGHMEWGHVGVYFDFLILSFVFWLCLQFVYYIIMNCQLRTSWKTLGIPILEKINNTKHIYWLYFGCILICWIPAFLAVYPGIYSYDAYPQVLQIIGNKGLNAHHPLIHTLLLNGCFLLGHTLTGDYNVGLTFYVIIQMLFMALVFARIQNKLRQYKLPLIIRIFSFAFLVFSPINQIWVCLTTKDTIFAGFFVLMILELIDILINSEKFFGNPFCMLRFVWICVFMCLFRNQGIYIIYVLVPFLVIIVKHYRKKSVLLLLSVIIIVKAFLGPVSTWMGVKPPNPREALSVPIQQMARTLVLYPENVTDEEKKIIYQYLPEEYINQYIAVTSDPVKEGFDEEWFRKNPLPFFTTWFSIGVRNLSCYIDSFLYESGGYFYTDYTPYWVEFILYDGSWMDQNILGIERNTLFPAYDDYLRSVSKDIIQDKVPLVSTILSEAFPFVVLLIVGSYLIIKKRYSYLLVLVPILSFWGTMILGPLCAIRYAFPVIVCVPVMLSLLFLDEKEKV